MIHTALDPIFTAVQRQQYYRDGYIDPFQLIPSEDMAALRRRIDDEVLTPIGRNPRPQGARLHCRHLDHAFLLELCRSPALIACARGLLGDDVVIWSSNFWLKPPGGASVPWHQDIDYWPINPQVNLTCWIAIDPTSRENGCLQVIPRSHRQRFAHTVVPDQMLDREATFDAAALAAPVALELAPGACVLFNERILHHSAANRSAQRRMGLGVRLTVPFVHVDQDGPLLYPDHRCVMLTGSDRFGLNRMLDA